MLEHKKPYTVKLATTLLYVVLIFILALGILSIIHGHNYRSPSSLEVGNGVYATLLLIGLFCLWLLFSLINLGWNFARYILLFLFMIDLLDWIIKFYGIPHFYLTAVFILSAIELALGFIALLLLFSPSANRWFKH